MPIMRPTNKHIQTLIGLSPSSLTPPPHAYTSYTYEKVAKPTHKTHTNMAISINSLKPKTLAQAKVI